MQLRLDVGVSATGSLTAIFRSFVASSAAARKTVAANLGGALADAEKVASGAAAKAGKEQVAAAQKTAAAHRLAGQIQADIIKSVQAQRNAEHKQFLADLKEEEREAKKVAKAIADERKKQAKAQREDERRGERVGSAAMRTFGGYLSRGVGVAKEIAGGLGADFSIGGNVGRARETFSAAGRATRSAATARGEIATAEDIQATVKAIRAGGDEAKLAYGDMAQGLEDFVSKSSDLKTGNAVLARMGMLAQATGASVKDLLSSAGDVNRELDDSPDRAERLMAIMRLVAKQGAMGNVEVKDLARYMGRITATAFMYEGSKDKNIGVLGALAQVAMKGGASSAAEATRSAAAFARDVTKAKSLESFAQAGIGIFTDKSKTKVRDPEKIIVDYLQKYGNLAKLSELFKNDASRKAVLGFQNIYTSAGGGKAGIAAVKSEFDKYSTTLGEDQVSAQAKTALEDPAAKAQAFQNHLETIAASMVDRVLPAFDRLAPNVEKAAGFFADMVGLAAEHPETAIVAALVAALGKAAIGEVIGPAIGSLIAKAGKDMGLLGGVLTLGVVALTAEKVIFDAKDAAGDKGRQNDVDNMRAEAFGEGAAKTGVISAADKAEFNKAYAALQRRIANAEEEKARLNTFSVPAEARAAYNFVAGGKDLSTIYQAQEDVAKLPQLQAELARLAASKPAVDAAKPTETRLSNAQEIGQATASALAPLINKGGGGPGVNNGARSDGVQ